MGAFPVQSGQLFLCIGDSITDCGRRGEQAPYGNGYVSLLREWVIARHPERAIRWLNRGIGGNTVLDLKNRWEDDVIREQPDWLSIKIGINDLHRHLHNGNAPVDPKLFEETYRGLLRRTKEALTAEIVLVDPFYLSGEKNGEGPRARVLKLLPEYLDAVRRLAREFETRHVPTQEIFEAQLKHRGPNDFANEPVHPRRIGHVIIANALYGTLCGE